MTSLIHEQFCAEIPAQAAKLREHLVGADLRVPAITCPGWTLGQLVRHLGAAHRWAELTVRTRAQEPVSDEEVNATPEQPDETATDGRAVAELGEWLIDGAERLARTLREAGPDAKVWSPAPEPYATSAFWARRMTHETVVHRADVAFAVGGGARYEVAEEVALDALDEWMEYGVLPEATDTPPGGPPLLGPGRTVHLHATDVSGGAGDSARGEWLVDLSGETPVWRHGHEKAAVALRGPLTDLLLRTYGRPPRAEGAVEVFGDAELLELWLTRSGFWLHAE
ncbi:maleylpyruvate isomerase N-terminal domain-containing protein [Streptomyces sp. 8N114]|uniref:maleylpyruvate isomerase N-terminal domain-containing protein n=1 Tax=Streptomyces sp. 8N114 TaxID=3457419 RepID=UPI003FD0AA6F